MGNATGVKVSRRALNTLAIGASVAVGVSALAPEALARGRVETPRYSVTASYAAFEVRRYEPRIVAEVVVEGQGQAASNAGFRVLADYIFGNNESRTAIAMTAPVDRQAEPIAMTAPVESTQAAGEGSEQRWVVAFTMPSKYTLDTLPRPRNPAVVLRELAPTSYAVVRFSGAPSEAKVQQRMDALAAALAAEGLRSAGKAPTYARYDPPWTPGFMRRNEISIELIPDS